MGASRSGELKLQLIPDQFWSEGWGCTPATIDGVQLSSFVTDQEFRTAIGLLQEYQNGEADIRPGTGLFLSVDGKRVEDNCPLAIEADSLQSFTSNLDCKYEEHEWNLMAYGLHAFSAPIWQLGARLRDEIDKSAPRPPTGRTDIDAFIGRYSSTFAGIHTDFAHNFAFTLANGKTMHVMKPENFLTRHWSDAAYFADSERLYYTEDSLCYFPHDYFHCATTADAAAINVNIAIWESAYLCEGKAPDHTHGLYNAVVDSYTRKLVEQPYLSTIIPEYLFDKLGAGLVARALKQVSAFGMEVKSPPLRREANFPMGPSRIIAAKANNEVRIFANGHILRLRDVNLPSQDELHSWLQANRSLCSYLEKTAGVPING